MLLTPPFDRTPHDPGYIKGYLPGVRENGAQYTHAALWAVLATALRGDGDRAFELFQMLNPLTHAHAEERRDATRSSRTWSPPTSTRRAGQLGRGGWTWYTGSASWMYRVGLEAILGFRSAATRSASSRACRRVAGVHHRLPLRPVRRARGGRGEGGRRRMRRDVLEEERRPAQVRVSRLPLRLTGRDGQKRKL
jgi:hypothetical protein